LPAWSSIGLEVPPLSNLQITATPLIRAIDSSDDVIFESKELAESFYHYDLYKPAVRNHLQQLAKGIKAVQVHEINARVRLKDGRDQGVVVISQQRHSAAHAP
jgi:hypothetical protein